MPQNVYSTRFITTKGLSGTGASYTVAAGLVAVVKEITVYASPLLGLTTVFFEDDLTGAAFWAQDATVGSPVTGSFYGGIVFEPGQGFHFQVNNAFGEAADVSAHGYLLTLP